MQHFQKQKKRLAYRYNYNGGGGGARGVCTIFAIFFGLCSWQRHSLCLVWCCGRDKATIVNNFIRDLYTTHLSSPSLSAPHLPLSPLYHLLLDANCINGQRAPFWVELFKLYFILLQSRYLTDFVLFRILCVFLFCCAHTHRHAHTRNEKTQFVVHFSGFHLPLPFAVCWLQIVSFRWLFGFVRFWQCILPARPTSQPASHSLRPHLLFAFLLHSPWLA